jgi:hypothetical protein
MSSSLQREIISTLETEEDRLSTLTFNTPPDSPVDGGMSTANLHTDQSAGLDEQNADIYMQILSSFNEPCTLDNKTKTIPILMHQMRILTT